MKQVSVLSTLKSNAQRALFKKISKEFPVATHGLLSILAKTGRDIWANEAINSSSWGEAYASTLRIKVSSSSSSVYVDERSSAYKYVGMMENGVKPWSIRDALLSSPKAFYTKNGIKVIIVPFRYRTPTSKGSGKVGTSFSGIIPKNIYQMAKRGELIGANAGVLTGLKRYGGKKHGQYYTFRMVSENTPTNAWQHPGKSPTPIFDRIMPKIVDMMNETIDNMIKDFSNEVRSGV